MNIVMCVQTRTSSEAALTNAANEGEDEGVTEGVFRQHGLESEGGVTLAALVSWSQIVVKRRVRAKI